MTIIPLRTPEEREYQKARLAYKQNPSLRNFEALRMAYVDLLPEREKCGGL